VNHEVGQTLRVSLTCEILVRFGLGADIIDPTLKSVHCGGIVEVNCRIEHGRLAIGTDFHTENVENSVFWGAVLHVKKRTETPSRELKVARTT
jgi:hypothetical protein